MVTLTVTPVRYPVEPPKWHTPPYVHGHGTLLRNTPRKRKVALSVGRELLEDSHV